MRKDIHYAVDVDRPSRLRKRAHQGDEIVPIEQVPANVMEVARKQLPGYTFDTAYKMKIDGKDAYEVRGKDKSGKVREVEVSVDRRSTWHRIVERGRLARN